MPQSNFHDLLVWHRANPEERYPPDALINHNYRTTLNTLKDLSHVVSHPGISLRFHAGFLVKTSRFWLWATEHKPAIKTYAKKILERWTTEVRRWLGSRRITMLREPLIIDQDLAHITDLSRLWEPTRPRPARTYRAYIEQEMCLTGLPQRFHLSFEEWTRREAIGGNPCAEVALTGGPQLGQNATQGPGLPRRVSRPARVSLAADPSAVQSYQNLTLTELTAHFQAASQVFSNLGVSSTNLDLAVWGDDGPTPEED